MRRLLFHAEALLALTVASVLIAALPFRRVARIMQGGAAAPVDPATARRIGRALRRGGDRVPWHGMCLQQGLAAHLMLRRRRRAATIHYGAAQEDATGTLVAHVWVTSGPVDVIGCEDVGRYALLATFPPH